MNNHLSLAKVVMEDMATAGRWPLIFLVLIILTALSVVYVTHTTRQIVAHHDELRNERYRLEVEMRNILLEEYTLSEHSRIEALAREKLQMIRPDNEHQIIVSQ